MELCRFAPVLLADDGDRFLTAETPVTVHGCHAGRWLQYWLAYPGDPDHAGIDWEMVMVVPGVEAVYARHRTATRRPWERVQLEDDHPVVWVGRDKHASYFSRGRFGWHRHGRHLERVNGRLRLATRFELDVPEEVAGRLSHREPDGWLWRLGV